MHNRHFATIALFLALTILAFVVLWANTVHRTVGVSFEGVLDSTSTVSFEFDPRGNVTWAIRSDKLIFDIQDGELELKLPMDSPTYCSRIAVSFEIQCEGRDLVTVKPVPSEFQADTANLFIISASGVIHGEIHRNGVLGTSIGLETNSEEPLEIGIREANNNELGIVMQEGGSNVVNIPVSTAQEPDKFIVIKFGETVNDMKASYELETPRDAFSVESYAALAVRSFWIRGVKGTLITGSNEYNVLRTATVSVSSNRTFGIADGDEGFLLLNGNGEDIRLNGQQLAPSLWQSWGAGVQMLVAAMLIPLILGIIAIIVQRPK